MRGEGSCVCCCVDVRVCLSVTHSVATAPGGQSQVLDQAPSHARSPLPDFSLLPQRAASSSHLGLVPAAGFLPPVPCRCALPLPRCPSVTWLRRTWPSCMCVPLPPHPAPCPAHGPPPLSQAWFSLLSLPGPHPPPPGPFSPSLSRFRKEASSAAPPGTPPPAQIPSAEKKPDPPVRPAWPPGLFVTQEPHLGRNGLGALQPPTPTSARPCRPTSLWPDRTGALLAPTALTWTGAPPCPPPPPILMVSVTFPVVK